jgi:hypothetical protein
VQKTDYLGLNLIETTDTVGTSLPAVNENFRVLEEQVEKIPQTDEIITQENVEKWNSKQDELVAGDGIRIRGNVISATGGGGGTGGGGTGDILLFNDIVVEVGDWVEDSTYEEFYYKAELYCEDVTDEFFANVVFGVKEAISGNYAPISETKNDTVVIYAVEIPLEDITIPSIACSKGV